jgi:cytochrome c oxidase assembly factor CtaG
MSALVQAALQNWSPPIPFTLSIVVAALLYTLGWYRLRLASVQVIPRWRAVSFLFGLLLIWVALGSPLSGLDEQLLTVHMIQHLLLMTVAPPLILLGAPLMPLLHGLPQRFVQIVVGPVFRWPPIRKIGAFVSKPAVCWLAAAAALIGWHIPSVFTLALRSETWHVAEHACFLGTGVLFWWPVIRPWPSGIRATPWFMLLYLFLATLPCDILSGFLAFSDRVAYPIYLSAPRWLHISALADQECAAALMWTCVTIAYLLPAAILTIQFLSVQNYRETRAIPSPGSPPLQGLRVPEP